MAILSGRDLTKFNEGLVLTAKPDRKGKWEIGRGHDIPPSPGLTWTEQQADDQFEIDYQKACSEAAACLGAHEYAVLSEPRQAVLNDIAFECGAAGLAGFHHLLAAIKACRWDDAALALHNSLLFDEVPTRENRNIAILMTGDWPTGRL